MCQIDLYDSQAKKLQIKNMDFDLPWNFFYLTEEALWDLNKMIDGEKIPPTPSSILQMKCHGRGECLIVNRIFHILVEKKFD